MHEPEERTPQQNKTANTDVRGLYREGSPRRMYVEDDGDTAFHTKISETLWRRPKDEAFRRPDSDDAAPHEDAAPRGARFAEPVPATPRFRATVLYTILSALLPGLGLIGSKQRGVRIAGGLLATAFVALGATALLLFAERVKPEEGESWVQAAASAAVGIAVGKGVLHMLTVSIAAVGLLWVSLIVGTHITTRAPKIPGWKKVLGAVLVTVLSLGVAGPLAVGANYSQVLASTIGTTFAEAKDVVSSSKPTIAGPEPFDGIPRLNILLLGSDLDQSRIDRDVETKYGLRTDTIILASVDTKTGETALIQIPRNVQYTPFPEGSEMAQEFPDGFRGEGDPGEWYVNSIWERVEADHPELFQGQTYPGAEALKQGVEGITGLHVHYFLMLNIDGLRNLVDAMGGVTVNVNERLPLGGSSDDPESTWGYLEIGADQHLDGLHAMWFARSRWASSDYSRMQRQSCLIKAITDQANPGTLLTRFEAIAGASSSMVTTDIPQEALESLTDLALKTQKQPMKRLVFINGTNGYDYDNPDFDTMRENVDKLINSTSTPSPSATQTGDSTKEPTTERTESPTELSDEGAQDVADACAFHPSEEDN